MAANNSLLDLDLFFGARANRDAIGRLEVDGKVLWQALPGPQRKVLFSQADELFYGGAAGGGKSFLLLGLALTGHRQSILFRRTYPELRQLIDQSRSLLAETGAIYNGSDHTWRDIPGGRALEFASLENEADRFKYQGRPHDLLLFDEVWQFSEETFRFLAAWARTTVPGQRVRIVCASNPHLRVEGEWIMSYWAPWLQAGHPNPAKPAELRWFVRVGDEDREVPNSDAVMIDGERVYPKSRTFIPARLEDNPYLLATNYGRMLQNLEEPLRSMLLKGDFNAMRQDGAWQLIPSRDVDLAFERWRSVGNDPPHSLSTIGGDIARGGEARMVIAKVYGNYVAPLLKYPGHRIDDGPKAATLLIQAMDTPCRIVIDIAGVGSSPYDILRDHGVKVVAFNNAERSDRTDRSGHLKFRNRRAEAYWNLKELLDPDLGAMLALPPDEELKAEICAHQWELGSQGIKIEDKETISKRIGHPPDCSDALVMALSKGSSPALPLAHFIGDKTSPSAPPPTGNGDKPPPRPASSVIGPWLNLGFR